MRFDGTLAALMQPWATRRDAPAVEVHPYRKHTTMLRWIITFLIIALVAGVFGFTGVAGAATDLARILFYIFLVLLLVAVVAGLFRGSPPAP